MFLGELLGLTGAVAQLSVSERTVRLHDAEANRDGGIFLDLRVLKIRELEPQFLKKGNGEWPRQAGSENHQLVTAFLVRITVMIDVCLNGLQKTGQHVAIYFRLGMGG